MAKVNLLQQLVQTLNNQSNKMKKVKSMTNAQRKAETLKVAQELCVPNNTVTTKEIKLELRKRFPNIEWNKYGSGSIQGVSDQFHQLVNEGWFVSVDDNGTFQTYADTTKPMPTRAALKKVPIILTPVSTGSVKGTSIATVPITSSKTTTVSTAKTVTIPATQTSSTAKTVTLKGVSKLPRLSRTKALQLMKDNKGRFFTAVFTKKDGEVRKINAQYVPDQDLSNLGYVKVREASKLKTNPSDSIRQINLQTLKTLKVGGVEYQIR